MNIIIGHRLYGVRFIVCKTCKDKARRGLSVKIVFTSEKITGR